jgi:16S rRNA (cytosine967-C5)-methyltransferase
VLTRVERDGAYASVALEAELASHPGIDPRDAGLAGELVHGTLRRQMELDAALERAAERPIARLESGVRPLLRMGAYQLLHLDRVPARAAVNETVELCKARRLTRATGLANAILRRLARDPVVPLPDDPVERLAIAESHPLWLVRRWVSLLGLDEATRLCRANNTPAPVGLRANLTRISRQELLEKLRAARPTATVEAGRFASTAISLMGAGSPSRLPGYAEGLFQVQDEAAQLVGQLLSPRAGSLALDTCAAPGGKSCHLAELGADVLAMDLSARKLERARSEAQRLGLSLRFQVGDASQELPVADGSQASVLVDAPCSGLGTVRRHPELRYRRQPDDLARLSDLQFSILRRAARAVALGGVLVYSVCSNEPEEGLAQRDRFLAECTDFVADPVPPSDAWEKLSSASAVLPAGAVATWPQRHGIDGFSSFRVRRR